MKVLLINPWGGEVFPTPAIGYLHATLKAAGADVTAVDLSGAFQETDYDIVGVTFHSFSVKEAQRIRHYYSKNRLICGGHHPSALPYQMLAIGYDQVVIGEGEKAIIDIINGNTAPLVYGELSDINSIPFPDYTGLSFTGAMGVPVITSRGCPFKCLHGDTLIDTTDGIIKIKDLIGKIPKVLTRDPITHDVLYAQVREVRLTEKNAKIVRVSFDNGDYIDCTPEHKFITFKNGNQNSVTTEKETEARNLKIGESIRAIHYHKEGNGYVDVAWGRRKRRKKHRLVIESRLGRKLKNNEHIHHIDGNKENNIDSNLLVTSPSEHIKYHPEIAERMRVNNAAKNMTKEQRIANGKANIGTRRTLESRIKYRNSKLGAKNPNYKGGSPKSKPNRTRIKEINHKITSVQYLDYTADVYCMEVPGYDWFYANQVLVHNCSFCASTHFWNGRYRTRTSENVLAELKQLTDAGIKTWMKEDDNFTANKRRAIEICKGIAAMGQFNWQCASRAESLDKELCIALKESGCRTVWLGIESLSQGALDRCNKNTTIDKMLTGIEIAEETGIETMCQFIIGLPGDTMDDIQTTVQNIRRSRIRRKGTNILWVVPGTEAYNKAKQQGFSDDTYLKSGAPYYTYEQDMTTLNYWAYLINQA